MIDDDEVMAGCIARACGDLNGVRVFTNAIEAMNEIAEGKLPDLVFWIFY